MRRSSAGGATPAIDLALRMSISLPRFYQRLAGELRKSKDFESSLAAMLAWGAANEPHPVWPKLSAIDVSGEAKAARAWMPKVLSTAPCPFPIRGIYFGLGEFVSKRIEYADVYFALFGQCDLDDVKSSWLWEAPNHYPDNARLKSKAMKAGGLLCNQDGAATGLSTEGYVCFSLSFAALLLRHVLDGALFARLGATCPIGVVTGFDSGNRLRLGSLASEGLILTQGAMT